MDVFVARQPIFTKNKEIFAYELLYRNSQENSFPDIDGDLATSDVLINSFLHIGIEELSNGKPCFINFTEKLLLLKIPTFFHPSEIVIEILEDVEISPELIAICKELKDKGYKIALDDFILNKNHPHIFSLFQHIDIIKVDFRNTTEDMRRAIEMIAPKYSLRLLAEKVETEEEYTSAIDIGYEYFQGYFFSKPTVLSNRDVPDYLQNYYPIIYHLSQKDPDIDQITWFIEQDLSLSYKLLKLINSPAFRPISKINSIRQAVVRLGFKELKKWLYLLSIRGGIDVNDEWTREILINSLTRAKMCEIIASINPEQKEVSSFFLTGMFSLMDSLLEVGMDQILKLMPLDEEICDALNGKNNDLKAALDLSIAFEKGDWVSVNYLCTYMGIEENMALNCFAEAFKWATLIMKDAQ